jgi:hypothetical protein
METNIGESTVWELSDDGKGGKREEERF